MNCIKCKAELFRDKEVCWHCGIVQATGLPAEKPPTTQCQNCGLDVPGDNVYCLCGQHQKEAVAESSTHPYQKFGGFLLFYLVASVFFMIWNVWTSLRPFSAIMQIKSSAIILSSFVIFVREIIYYIPLIQLLKCKSVFLRNVLVFYPLSTMLSGTILGVLIVAETNFPLLIIPLLVNCIFGIIANTLLMRWYLTTSVRVRTYMGTHEYITKNPFTKKVMPPQPAVPDARTFFPDPDQINNEEVTQA